MNVTSTHGTTLIRNAFESMRPVANRLARNDLSDLPRDMVTLSGAKRSVQVGTALIRTEQEMQGTLLDLLA